METLRDRVNPSKGTVPYLNVSDASFSMFDKDLYYSSSVTAGNLPWHEQLLRACWKQQRQKEEDGYDSNGSSDENYLSTSNKRRKLTGQGLLGKSTSPDVALDQDLDTELNISSQQTDNKMDEIFRSVIQDALSTIPSETIPYDTMRYDPIASSSNGFLSRQQHRQYIEYRKVIRNKGSNAAAALSGPDLSIYESLRSRVLNEQKKYEERLNEYIVGEYFTTNKKWVKHVQEDLVYFKYKILHSLSTRWKEMENISFVPFSNSPEEQNRIRNSIPQYFLHTEDILIRAHQRIPYAICCQSPLLYTSEDKCYFNSTLISTLADTPISKEEQSGDNNPSIHSLPYEVDVQMENIPKETETLLNHSHVTLYEEAQRNDWQKRLMSASLIHDIRLTETDLLTIANPSQAWECILYVDKNKVVTIEGCLLLLQNDKRSIDNIYFDQIFQNQVIDISKSSRKIDKANKGASMALNYNLLKVGELSVLVGHEPKYVYDTNKGADIPAVFQNHVDYASNFSKEEEDQSIPLKIKLLSSIRSSDTEIYHGIFDPTQDQLVSLHKYNKMDESMQQLNQTPNLQVKWEAWQLHLAIILTRMKSLKEKQVYLAKYEPKGNKLSFYHAPQKDISSISKASPQSTRVISFQPALLEYREEDEFKFPIPTYNSTTGLRHINLIPWARLTYGDDELKLAQDSFRKWIWPNAEVHVENTFIPSLVEQKVSIENKAKTTAIMSKANTGPPGGGRGRGRGRGRGHGKGRGGRK